MRNNEALILKWTGAYNGLPRQVKGRSGNVKPDLRDLFTKYSQCMKTTTEGNT